MGRGRARSGPAAGLGRRGWSAWEGAGGYEACFDTEHPVAALGQSALVRLFRDGSNLVGLSLRFRECAGHRTALAAAVRQEFKLEAGPGDPYHAWEDGAVVHLAHDPSDDTCTLTVAGPRFGRAFQAYQLRLGFGSLFRGH